MKPESLEQNVKRQALAWTTGGIIFTLCLTGSLSLFLMFQDAAREVENLSASALASGRTEILSGDVRATELRFRKNLGLKPNDRLLFLDQNRAVIHYEIPMAELVGDFYDDLKSVTS